LVSNNPGTESIGVGKLIHSDRVSKVYLNWHNKEFHSKFREGKFETEFVPEGTLAEKL
jgi:acyl CoA:acetate/3-ketoacid CoA transferase alpha subunit